MSEEKNLQKRLPAKESHMGSSSGREEVTLQSFARKRRFQESLNSWVVIFFVFIIYLMLNYWGYRYYWRKDYSPGHFYELSGKSKNLLKYLPDQLKIITYFSPQATLRTEIDTLIQEYQFAAGDRLVVEKIDPALDLERAQKLARELNFREEENLIILEYKDQRKFIAEEKLAEYEYPSLGEGKSRLVSFQGEAMITGAIQALLTGEPAQVYFLKGHGELDSKDASSLLGLGKLIPFIKRDHIEVHSLNLLETAEVPEEADALVIVGPRESMSDFEIAAIARYLNRQGKVFLFQGPDTTSGLENLSQKYGIKLDNDVVRARVHLNGVLTLVEFVAGTSFADHPAVRNLKDHNLLLHRARSLSLLPLPDGRPNPKVTALLETPPGYWGETNLTDSQSPFDPESDKEGPLIIAAVYDGGGILSEQVQVAGTRLIVVGATHFLTNRYLNGTGVDFFTNCLNWLLEKEIALGIGPKLPHQFPIEVTPLQMRSITWIVCALMPGIALVAGIFVGYSRRK